MSKQTRRVRGGRDYWPKVVSEFEGTGLTHLDRWDAAGVRFVFGYDANRHFINRA